MRILIVHHQMKLYGGAELVVVRLAKYLQKWGHRVRILAASTSSHPEYNDLDIVTPAKETAWHLWDGTISSLREIYGVYSSLTQLCKEQAKDFDVINPHNFPTVWCVPKNSKAVWMCNEVPDLWHRKGITSMVDKLLNMGRYADRILTRSKNVSAVVADENIAERFYSRYGLKPTIIPYGIDGDFFAQKSNVYRRESSKLCIIQPSMISPSKGQMDLLEAIRDLDVKVIFAGYREPLHPYVRQLDRFVQDNDIDAVFTGHRNKYELRDLYYTAHVAVFPGKGQGSWLGPFEALASGCPIIVSPNLSCSALIKQHQLGIVTFDIGSAFREIQCNYPKYQQQALRGRELVLDKLTWNNFGAKMMELMER